MSCSLHCLAVGIAAVAHVPGSASAVLERDAQPMLLIVCGAQSLLGYDAAYAAMPDVVFVVHLHADHIGELERLFFAIRFDPMRCGKVRSCAPVVLVSMLHAQVADCPGVLAEGGSNFRGNLRDAFQLVPVGRSLWHRLLFDVFAVRHHAPGSVFGLRLRLRLRSALVWTDGAHPIREILTQVSAAGELITHDRARYTNPSRTGMDDMKRNYDPDFRARPLPYHCDSVDEVEYGRAVGGSVAVCAQRVALRKPIAPAGEMGT